MSIIIQNPGNFISHILEKEKIFREHTRLAQGHTTNKKVIYGLYFIHLVTLLHYFHLVH